MIKKLMKNIFIPLLIRIQALEYSMGLIADYVVETGTSGIWTYEKWYSGKAVAEMTRTSIGSVAFTRVYESPMYLPAESTSISQNGIAISGFDVTITFPSIFASVKTSDVHVDGFTGAFIWNGHTVSNTYTKGFITKVKSETITTYIEAKVVGTWS